MPLYAAFRYPGYRYIGAPTVELRVREALSTGDIIAGNFFLYRILLLAEIYAASGSAATY